MSVPPPREAVLQLLRDIGPQTHLYLMGGFAEDALLEHRITRDRADLDFLVQDDAQGEWRADLQRLGSVRLEPLLSDPTGNTLAFGSSERGFPIEVWRATQAGGAYEIVLPGGSGFFRLKLPSDTFEFIETTLEGVRVRTISPRALALFRAASAQTRGDAEKRAADQGVLQRIADELLSGCGISELTPHLAEL